MPGILLLSSSKTAIGTVLASLATDGFRHGVRNHGYSINDYALLLRHSRGSAHLGIRHLPRGNTSSLLCLCGISVSLAFYVLYLKFYPRCYDSVFLKRVLKRLLQTRSQRQASSISSRKKQTLQHATSLSIINETCSNEDDDDNDDNNNNSIKTSDAGIGVCSVGSVDSSKQDGVIFGEFHQMPAVAASTTTAAAAAAELRIRHRITRRRRTLSDSPDVIARLDDFIRLIPEIVERPRHVQRTRNVLDWLAQIDFDPDNSLSLFDEDPLDDVSGSGLRTLVHSPECTESGIGCSSGCIHHSRDCSWCQECLSSDRTDCVACGTRSGQGSYSTAMEVQEEDQHQGLYVVHPDGQEAELRRRTSVASGLVGGVVGRGEDNRSSNQSSVVQVSMLDGGPVECVSEVATVNASDDGLDASKKKVFYFEEDESDTTSEKDVPLQPKHFETSSSEQRHVPDSLHRQGHHLGPAESSSVDGPHCVGAGYDWLRVRILGADRKRRISTGSALSAKFLASRGLLRNHHSFTSAISGASSGYTYRESLVSKGFSIDCGEDLTDLAFQGEDLLEAAEFSRYTLTSIDQLHEELEVIQRSIKYINNKVEFLQLRDDLPNFAARYGFGIDESIGNDLCIVEAADLESGMRRQRSRSLSLTPGYVTEAHIVNELEDVHPAVVDEFAWDYGSDLVLNPVYSHHRSLNGLAGSGEEQVSNRLGVRRSRSDEMEFNCRMDLSSEDLTRLKSDDVCDDDPEMTSFAQVPARQRNESICDEYFDDDYDMLTHLHS